jgi:hypothetical protein
MAPLSSLSVASRLDSSVFETKNSPLVVDMSSCVRPNEKEHLWSAAAAGDCKRPRRLGCATKAVVLASTAAAAAAFNRHSNVHPNTSNISSNVWATRVILPRNTSRRWCRSSGRCSSRRGSFCCCSPSTSTACRWDRRTSSPSRRRLMALWKYNNDNSAHTERRQKSLEMPVLRNNPPIQRPKILHNRNSIFGLAKGPPGGRTR